MTTTSRSTSACSAFSPASRRSYPAIAVKRYSMLRFGEVRDDGTTPSAP